MKSTRKASLALVKLCCRALAEKKAGDLRVLDVGEKSTITDFLVIATGTSEPHLRALRIELEKAIDAAHTHLVGIETAGESGWTVVDAFDVMVHLFSEEKRQRFGLEKLWRDAPEVSVDKLLEEPAKKRKPAARSAAPAKRRKAKA